VALRLLEHFPHEKVAILHHDSYYRNRVDLPLEERRKLNFDHPDSFENELLVVHLGALREGGRIEQPVYSYETHSRDVRTLPVGPASLVIVEGITVLAVPELRALMDIKLYVDCDADERLVRRLLRDLHERGRTVHSVLEQYRATVRPMHLQFVEPSKRWADLVIPRGGHNAVAIDLIVSKMREVLARAEREEASR
jgi:uridine kinase